MNNITELINFRLAELVDKYQVSLNLYESMKYSISAGGKRIRPAIVLSMIADIDESLVDKYLDLACSLEFVHTYSLIHDDLPAMDNSMYRRGKLTNHQVFGEDIAILAGDALLTESFNIIVSSDIEDELKVKCVKALSSLSGANGMVAGQALDVKNVSVNSIHDIEKINYHKTHDLILCAFLFGAYALGFSDDKIKMIEDCADSFGLSFQIKDDIDDITKTSFELGKDSQNDQQNSKMTYPHVYGLDASRKLLNTYKEKTLSIIKQLFGENHLYKLIKGYYD